MLETNPHRVRSVFIDATHRGVMVLLVGVCFGLFEIARLAGKGYRRFKKLQKTDSKKVKSSALETAPLLGEGLMPSDLLRRKLEIDFPAFVPARKTESKTDPPII